MDFPSFAGVPRPAAETGPVLVIDDDAELRASIALMLRDHGLAVETASDGAQGLRIARRTKPGIVLVDLGLPTIDGWDVIGELRGARLPRRPYIIVMSGFVDARSRQRAFEAGCDQYIVKEAGPDALVAAVRTYLTRLDTCNGVSR